MTVRVNLSAGFGQTQRLPGGWIGLARSAESLGYETLQVADHLTIGDAAPFTAMASAAAVTDRLRVGTYVLNNDFRHPVMVAHEMAALADLSGGRATLGLGAGHMRYEYQQAGLTYDTAGRRVRRMAESAAIIRRLLDGETVSSTGEYDLDGHAVRGEGAAPVRLLIGGNGTTVLQTAGRIADVVGFTGFTPSADGAGSEITHFTEVGLAERITVARAAAGNRWPLPIDVLVQVVVVTDRPDVAIDRAAARMQLPQEAVRSSPFVLIGSTQDIADRLRDLEARLGVTSVTVFANRPNSDQTELTMAPVIEALQ